MCENCEEYKKSYVGANRAGTLYLAPLSGTCGGYVLWGWYGTYEDYVKSLAEAEEKARQSRKTIIVATLAPTEDRVKALTEAGWTMALNYSTRYGKRREGSLQLWVKEIVYDTNF